MGSIRTATVQCLTFRKKCWGQLAPKSSFWLPVQVNILVAKNYVLELIEYNKLNIFYLALTEKDCFRLPLNFISNGFRLRLDYLLVFGKMNPPSSVNFLKQVFKQWNTHLGKQTLGITKHLFGLLKNKICKICFACHVFACSEMNMSETWTISR